MSSLNQAAVANAKLRPKRTVRPRPMPRYRVILLNDDVNQFGDVVKAVRALTPLSEQDAVERTTEAHKTGRSLLLVVHRERAELYQQQFAALLPPIGIEIEPEP